MTPRQFHLLRESLDHKINHEERMFGQIAQAVVNYGYCRPEEFVKTEVFMPSEWGKIKRPKKPTKIDLAAKVRSFTTFKKAKAAYLLTKTTPPSVTPTANHTKQIT